MKRETIGSSDPDAISLAKQIKSLFPDLNIPLEALDNKESKPKSYKFPFTFRNETYDSLQKKAIKKLYLDCCSEAHELAAEYFSLEKDISLNEKPKTVFRWNKGARSFYKTLGSIGNFENLHISQQELLGITLHTFFSPDFNDTWAINQGINVETLRASLLKKISETEKNILVSENISTIELIILFMTIQKYAQKKRYVSYSETHRRHKSGKLDLTTIFTGGIANPFSRTIDINYFHRDALRAASLLQISIALLTSLAAKSHAQPELFMIPAALFFSNSLLSTMFSAHQHNEIYRTRKHEIIHQLQRLYTGKNGFKRY